jgi:WD repeat-containing protein 26
MDGELTSLKISQDSRFALINHPPDVGLFFACLGWLELTYNKEIRLWDLHASRLARKFTGQRQGRYIIRSCFGGVEDNLIVSGSEGVC